MKTEKNLIFLVDDDEDDQLIFQNAVSALSSDYQCMVTCDGQEAFDTLEKMSLLPSIVFLDLNMPYMNGFDFLERFKRDTRYKDIPIIMYTTSKNPLDAKNTLDAGADLFFTKPSDFKLLKLKLGKILASEMKSR